MTYMTYVLQTFATVFMLAASALMVMSFGRGNWMLFGINLVLFAANAGLFFWQWHLRSAFNL